MKKALHAGEAFDMEIVPRAIPRFIEDNCQNMWRRSANPYYEFKHPVFLCISQNGTLATMQVYDLPIRPDFWNLLNTSTSATSALPGERGDDVNAEGECSGSTVAAVSTAPPTASFVSTYARYFSTFTHENLVQYISVATIPRSPLVCIISEYVPGGTLAQNAESYTRRLPLAAVKRYSISILRALHYLHAKKHIVHGRLNPHNILVGVDGHCKLKGMIYLFDWVRRSPDASCALLKNMAAYNAPEINAGESRTPASDIYSFGLVLLGMLTWSAPWTWAGNLSGSRTLTDTVNDDKLFLSAYMAKELQLRTYETAEYESSESGSSNPPDEEGKVKETAVSTTMENSTSVDAAVLERSLQKVLQRALAASPEDRKSAASLLRILSKAA
ncbi:protein kinase [Strigomonas culicis]|uniref:Protein kinase n=1 Tax=Strigomonas culicis TaxID=28005 RepID=S9UXC4_9TRYP|nr:protein kinase [Strigomonas culicis]|eukprot:EPY15175.1 protein kinase [Strigomonas culicis]